MKFIVTKDSIIIPRTVKKGTEMRVYFSRSVDERTMSDVPMAHTKVTDVTSLRWNELDWTPEYYVLLIEMRRPRFFGIFGREWIKVEHEQK